MSNNKKYAIISWIGVVNYGTNLQAIALYKAFSKYIKDCEVINIIFNAEKIGQIKNSLFLIKLKIENLWRKYPLCPKIRYNNTNRFIENECICKVVDSHSKLKKLEKEYDCFVVGSDQVWNPAYINDSYNLAFIKDKPKYSYASSIGVTEIDKDKQKYYDKLSLFKKISVREDSAIQLLSKHLHRDDIQTVVDPTLLLGAAEWHSMSSKANIPEQISAQSKYLLFYFVEPQPNYLESINKIKQKYKDTPVIILNGEIDSKNITEGIRFDEAGPYEFLWLIEHASVICTDSFHATTISLIFNKEFWVIKRFKDEEKKSQNSRIDDLFNMLSIDRYCNNIDSNESNLDFEVINDKLDKLKKSSENYLKSILDNE